MPHQQQKTENYTVEEEQDSPKATTDTCYIYENHV